MQPKRITRKRGPWRDRFWSKVNKDGDISEHRFDLGPCWAWTAYVDRGGYGRFCRSGSKAEYAHVIAYEESYGQVPTGLELDHLCHNGDPECVSGVRCRHRRCVNPEHLEAVTHQVNALRGNGYWSLNARGDHRWTPTPKAHCKRGHEMVAENVYAYTTPSGRVVRMCKSCRRLTASEWYIRKRDS